MKKTIKNVLFLFLSISIFSCNAYKYGEAEAVSSNLTYGIVKSKIIKGETNQVNILQIFGSPNIITKNKSNNEVWSYNKMSVNQKGGETYVFSQAKGSYSSSTTSFDLIISFTNDDIVNDYSVISTKF